MIKFVQKARNKYTTMKIPKIQHMQQITTRIDGDIITEIHQTHMSKKQVHTITNGSVESAVNAQLHYTTTVIEALDQRDGDDKPIRC